MVKLERALSEKKQEYCRLIQQAERRLKELPEGSIRTSPHRGKPHYYIRTAEDFKKRHYNGHHIPGKNVELISALCNRHYWEKVYRIAMLQLEQLNNFEKMYHPQAILETYTSLPAAIAKYAQPVELPDEEFAAQWAAEEYEKKPFTEGTPEIYTLKNERVRSKSEKIIADSLISMGIPYKYEKPLRLTNGKWIHPDFHILSIAQRREYILEHFGMMDDPVYAENALRRLYDYEKSGIWPGENLIITFETAKTPLNSRLFEVMVKKYIE